jgi:predicted Zn-dependent protease
MVVVDAILEPYVNAATLVQAERELDRLAGRADELPVRLGDLYDELAGHAADEDEHETAVRLEKKAIAAGCGQPFVAREMLGWYLLKVGATDEGESVFRELCDERPHDAGVLTTLGHARSDAGLQAAALEAFDEALAVAKRGADRAGSTSAAAAPPDRRSQRCSSVSARIWLAASSAATL